MKVKEIIEKHGMNCVEVEVYNADRMHFRSIHTDSIRSCYEYDENDEVLDFEVMCEERYNDTVLANSCVSADFSEWYGDNNAQILVIIIPE